jgi:hypothetical protein
VESAVMFRLSTVISGLIDRTQEDTTKRLKQIKTLIPQKVGLQAAQSLPIFGILTDVSMSAWNSKT